MKRQSNDERRRLLGRVSTDTKGPPGVVMEGAGLWNGHNLTD